MIGVAVRHGKSGPSSVIALVALAATLSLAGCSSAGGSSPTTVPGGTVSLRLGYADWDSINPNKTTGAGYQLLLAMYDRLLALGPGGKIVPYLARSWKLTPGSILLAIRTDAVCDDGTKVDATVVANSFNHMFAPATRSPALREYGSGPYSAVADDPEHVTINVGNNFTDLLVPLADPPAGIVCPAGLASGADLENHSYGSGPYTLVSAKHGDGAELKLKSNWKWGPNGVTASTHGLPSTIQMKIINNETTAANQLLTGGLDISLVRGVDQTRLVSDKSLIHHTVHTPMAVEILFNEGSSRPTSDPRVREALQSAIDRKALNQALTGGLGLLGTSLWAPDIECFDPQAAKLLPAQDLNRAKSLLQQAGYVAGSDGRWSKDGKPLAVTVVGRSPDTLQGADYIADQLGRVGVSATLMNPDSLGYLQRLNSSNFDLMVFQIQNPLPDPSITIDFLVGKLPPAGQNFARVDNQEAAQAVADARTSTGAAICRNWTIVQEKLLQRHDVLPVAYLQTTWFSRHIEFAASTVFLEPTTLRRLSG